MCKKLLLLIFIVLLLSILYAEKVGFALSGGGARGFAHIGMLKVLEEVGIKPSYISGTSIGALIGGMYAIGYNAAEIESIFISIDWNSILSDNWRRDELYIGQKRWAAYGNATFHLDDNWIPRLPQSVLIGNKINLELFRIFSSASSVTDFYQLPIPFSCIATDLVTGRLKVFDSGSLVQSIRASMSIPSLMQPFPLNNTLYIDGGISQNLPGKQVKDMGADYVLGFKVNTTLKNMDKIHSITNVLDQTINIGITNRITEQLSFCDYILEPDLESFSASNFNNIHLIIKAGEEYARSIIDDLITLSYTIDSELSPQDQKMPLPRIHSVTVKGITVKGNKYLSTAKVKEYTGLTPDTEYAIEQILSGINHAWNSQLFDTIYPTLHKYDEKYTLVIHVKEKERKNLTLNVSYDRDNDLVAGSVFSLHNFYLKNSHLFAELKLGGKHEFNLDIVKNFGEYFGIYYRIFPYINEKRIFFYNDDHEIITSARSLEYGATTGIGIYASKLLVLEGYAYTCKNKLYREIAINNIESSSTISGLGLKSYHESLDDFTFPMSGMKAFLKTSFSKKDLLSDETQNRLFLSYQLYNPTSRILSLLVGFQYGTHFKDNRQSSLNTFYLGGLDRFAGFPKYEYSAPNYKLAEAGILTNPFKQLYVSMKMQTINFANYDALIPENNRIGGVLELGVKTYLGPIKTAVAFSEKSRVQYYLSFGYTNDIFHFSRK